MCPSNSSWPSVSRVPAPTSNAGIVIEVPGGPSVGCDAQGEALPLYSV